MAKLSQTTLESVQIQPPIEQAAPVQTVSRSWTDYLPSGCELPPLFRTGIQLSEALELIGNSSKELDKICKKACSCTCQNCRDRWAKAAQILVLQQQLQKAAAGDSAMLSYVGKAILRQTEPAPVSDEIIPTELTIVGLDLNQEQEIQSLRAEVKSLRQLAALEVPAGALPPSEDDGGA